MKKNCIRFTLAACLCTGIVAFTGCGKKDPFTVYSEASQKTSELSSMEAVSDMTISMTAAGETMDITAVSEMKMSGISTDDMTADIFMSMDLLGQTMDIQTYYDGGYYYMDASGSQIKYAMDLADFEDQLATNSVPTDLDKESFKEISLETKDKTDIVTFTIDGTKMSDTIQSALGSLEGLTALEGTEMTIGDVTGSASVNKDGYFTSVSMVMPLTVSVSGEEISMDIDITVDYTNPGTDVTVELPEELDSYMEVDLNALSGADTEAADSQDSADTQEDSSIEEDTAAEEEADTAAESAEEE